MLQLFRNFFKSKIGVGITLVFLVVIAIAFGTSDVANTSLFGGVAGGDRVAVVGSERIDAAELQQNMTNALDEAKQTDPTLTMQAFIAQGGMESVLEQLLNRAALAEFARKHGMRASDRAVDSELLKIPGFRGADGNFDEAAFRAAIAQRGFTEALVREDLASNLLARQLLTPIGFSPSMPASVARRYASLLRERRNGAIALLPSSAFAPKGAPTNAQLQAFYRAHTDDFIRPERRVIRYASFGEEALGDLPAPTEAQVRQRYDRDRAQYAASEERSFTQLVVPTQDAALAIIAEVRGGKSLDAAAREKGLATAQVGPVTKTAFTTASSAAVAQAAFTAAQGAIATPARGGLGWYVLRVDKIERKPARSLAQVRDEIAAALAVEQRRTALADLTARIEEEFDEGRRLAEVARDLKVTVRSTAPAVADGRIYGSGTETVPPILGRVLQVAFDMEEQQAQIAPLADGQTFLVFDVADITPSATAPLNEIRDDVITAWRIDEGAKRARAAADRILQRVTRGGSLAAAVAAESTPLPAPQQLDLNRQQLAERGRVPSELALFFSMAEGTVKKLEAPGHAGWYVVRLDDIAAPQVAADDPLVLATMQQLAQLSSEEYVEQFVGAAQREVGVERNQAAIDAVRAQLTGQNNQ
jgi:peptidyl-prolyl cis-trans isomerase D